MNRKQFLRNIGLGATATLLPISLFSNNEPNYINSDKLEYLTSRGIPIEDKTIILDKPFNIIDGTYINKCKVYPSDSFPLYSPLFILNFKVKDYYITNSSIDGQSRTGIVKI